MKKLSMVLIAAGICLMLTACGGKGSSAPAQETVTEAATEAETEAQTEAPMETEEQPEVLPEMNGDMTVSQVLTAKFDNLAGADLQTIADGLLEDMPFMGASMEVEEGYLNGFTDEIKGFKSGMMFSPMIGSMPFVGYVFEVDEAEAEAFVETLKEKADLRWNICTEADECVTMIKGDQVFFVMCPLSFEEEE